MNGKRGPTKGTELGGRVIYAPGVEYGNQSPNVTASPSQPVPFPALPPPPNQTLQFAVASVGQTRNDGGAGLTVKDLSTIQAALVQLGFSFSGGSSDDNQWGIPLRLPDNYDPSRPIVATLAVVQD